jgi:hypothetical protein
MRTNTIVKVVGFWGALAAGGVGCGLGAAGTCSTYASCGGDPSGGWTLDEGCLNLVVRPYQQLSLPQEMQQPQDPTLEPPQPQPTTSGSWCSDLIYQPANKSAPVVSVVLWHGPLKLRGGTIFHNNDTDKLYTATIKFGAQQRTFFPAECLGTYQTSAEAGAAADPQQQCTDLEAALVGYLTTQPSFQFVDVTDPSTGAVKHACEARNGGCDCTYDYQLISSDGGVWEIDPNDKNVLIHHSKTASEAQRTTFCATDGQHLQMTGIDGTGILNQLGLRSLSYVKM